MITRRVSSIAAGIVLLGSGILATSGNLSAAHAASAAPTIIANSGPITDSNGNTIGMAWYIGGANFTPGGYIDFKVYDNATGALLNESQEQATVGYSVATDDPYYNYFSLYGLTTATDGGGFVGWSLQYSGCSAAQVRIQATDLSSGQTSTSVVNSATAGSC